MTGNSVGYQPLTAPAGVVAVLANLLRLFLRSLPAVWPVLLLLVLLGLFVGSTVNQGQLSTMQAMWGLSSGEAEEHLRQMPDDVLRQSEGGALSDAEVMRLLREQQAALLQQQHEQMESSPASVFWLGIVMGLLLIWAYSLMLMQVGAVWQGERGLLSTHLCLRALRKFLPVAAGFVLLMIVFAILWFIAMFLVALLVPGILVMGQESGTSIQIFAIYAFSMMAAMLGNI